MTRTLTLTAAEWAVMERDREAWIVRPAGPGDEYRQKDGSYTVESVPPKSMLAAAAPCETCGGSRGGVAAASSGYMQGSRVRYAGAGGMSLTPVNCLDCRITLLGVCDCCGGPAPEGGLCMNLTCTDPRCPNVHFCPDECAEGYVAIGYAYAASEVQMIWRPGVPAEGTQWATLVAMLGFDPSADVGKYALKLVLA